MNNEMALINSLLAESTNYVIMLSSCIFYLLGYLKYKRNEMKINTLVIVTLLPITIGMILLIANTNVIEIFTTITITLRDFTQGAFQ